MVEFEDPLEQEMATHLSILVWKIPRTEEPGHNAHCGGMASEEKGSTWKGQETSLGSFVEQNLNLARVSGKLCKGDPSPGVRAGLSSEPPRTVGK